MKLRCAILDDYQQAALTMADWSPISELVEVQSFDQHVDQEDELVKILRDYEIIVIMRERTPFPASLFARLPKLKMLITSGMRNASIDLAAAASHGVVVCGTGSKSDPPTELTWALILGLARHIVQENNAIRANGRWQSTIGTDLYGKQLGVLGLGKIGSKVARIGMAFGMNVTAWSQNLSQEQADAVGVRLAASKEELLESSDFVSIHLVLSDRTRGLLGREELQRMRPTAYLINTSRAAIVDQPALIEALQNRWIAGAGIDVFDMEPLSKEDPFRKLSNALTTPHLGYVSQGNYHTYYREAVENIQAFLSGAPIRKLS
ncbi:MULTISPECIES: D-2-hydroxyacid dehydrogenase family protein [unclassified Paenibacillus]|uniref:D-2-hydroxyacid dehydrogenase family protein n=1 Tax=unclassified Paenibacillus TaxID=185978 RepID=UPI001AE3E988|nr:MULTISPECIES: D-2-hydroxyacid dehydrogenase family protein [unclassified Paenibacillus]MBP1155806.1 phosphoglycerate dehydrogenase-like enzyme [Paenibacillus sp. PvP091]MBP1168808.1 phosphoglycerate dehydrogenase-like enzyme [Paenibacillus sp. PvR098]MBP2439836.1 phosphoglycerate dehydrogenase-like enzyme [Paenibacillus sp. PvP052]